MPYAIAKDNVRLHFEEAGSGTPIIFLHEFAADHTNWEPQMRYFSRGHRCIAYSARGYTPSDVPPSAEVYTYKHFYTDALAVLIISKSGKHISSGFRWARIRRCRSPSTRRNARAR
jgi:proline iminopeptidase